MTQDPACGHAYTYDLSPSTYPWIAIGGDDFLRIDSDVEAHHTGGPVTFTIDGTVTASGATVQQTFTVNVVDTCLTSVLSFPTVADLMYIRVNDPLGPFLRTIVPSDTESVRTSTPNFCGEYTYSYAPTNAGETFPFT